MVECHTQSVLFKAGHHPASQGYTPPLGEQTQLSCVDLVSPSYFAANNYMESKCEAVLREMRKCCARYPEGRSICCSGFEKEEREKRKAASEGIPPPPQ